MAGNEPQKQLLSLIRDFATEKSQGERRIESLKKRIEELRSSVNMENSKLDEVKRQKETIEQEIKGYEVELAMVEVSILALEARIVSAQGEISSAGSDLESLKNEEGAKRDDFIKRMFELNGRIRGYITRYGDYCERKVQLTDCALFNPLPGLGQCYVTSLCHWTELDLPVLPGCREFQASFASALNEDYVGTRSANVGCIFGICEDVNAEDAEVCIKDIENKTAEIISQTNLEEQEYQTELKVHELVQQELSDLESKVSLIEKIMEENRKMQELTSMDIYIGKNATVVTLIGNKQISEQEEKCASFGDELQRRLLCPSCHQDNSESLHGLLQAIN